MGLMGGSLDCRHAGEGGLGGGWGFCLEGGGGNVEKLELLEG